jgi:hypothetical protein
VILLYTLGVQTTHLELEQEISEQSCTTTKPAAFWEVTPCNLALTYLPTKLHGVTSQKAAVFSHLLENEQSHLNRSEELTKLASSTVHTNTNTACTNKLN